MNYSRLFLDQTALIADSIGDQEMEKLARLLFEIKGRVYVIGLGGSMANAIHFAADLRKLCEIDAEAFSNIAELTARANDEGFDNIFSDWLSKFLTADDCLFVLSVGGGTASVSTALVKGMDLALERGARILGIVGPDGGYAANVGDCIIKIPAINVTPHTEAFQAVIWHCLVTHPLLQKQKCKW